MKAIKGIMDFARFAIALLIEFARNTVTMMTGNAYFPTPLVPLAQITSAVNDLEAKFNLALGGGKTAKANMRLAVKTLVALLKKQVAYVNTVAGGVEGVILSSGFHTSAKPKPTLLTDFSLSNGKSAGSIIAKHKAVKGARTYVWQRANDPLPTSDSGWAYVGFTTRRQFTDTGLVSGTKHWYRVAWVTKDGLSGWSAPMSIIVL